VRFFLFGPRVFGLRTGISLGREDWAKLNAQPKSTGTGIDPDHSFLYVIKGDRGLVKIGMTTNPTARLAQLRSALSLPLEFAWIGASEGRTIAIEREAHSMLAQYRRNGEWFEISPDAAVGAVNAAAYRLGQSVLGMTPERAEEIVQIARGQTTIKPTSALARAGIAILQLIAGMILSALLIGWVLIRFVRVF
jgi:hypothetical protein